MTIKEFFEADFKDFEEIKIYKNNDNTDNNLIAHSWNYTKTIIKNMDTMRLNNFWFVTKKVIFILFLLFKWLIKGIKE